MNRSQTLLSALVKLDPRVQVQHRYLGQPAMRGRDDDRAVTPLENFERRQQDQDAGDKPRQPGGRVAHAMAQW